jgi:protein ImuA
MIDQLRQRLQALEKPAALDGAPGCLPLGVAGIDAALGGGLARGALHEIAAASEAHLAAASGFALGLSCLSWPGLSRPSRLERHCVPDRDARHKAGHDRNNILWIAEDMALAESGAPCGLGLDAFLAPERLLTVAVAHRRDLLWAMEEALRCRAIAAVIGELRHGDIDAVATRRLSLAAAESGTLALLLRAQPARDASTAATRWIVGAAPSSPEMGNERKPRFAAHLIRNRRGPLGSWILEWSDSDAGFVLVPHDQPVAVPTFHRPDRKVA